MEIPDPPEPQACAGCAQPISWMWSPRKERWIAFVAASDGAFRAIAPHMCAPPLQDPKTWRQLPHGDPPSAEYVEWKNKIATRSSDDEAATNAG